MTAVEVLKEAKRLLTEVGWVRGTFREATWTTLPSGIGQPGECKVVGYCMLGACREAAGLYEDDKSPQNYEHYNDAVVALADCVRGIGRFGLGGIAQYNDNFAKDLETDVLPRFDCAIEKVTA